VTGLTKNISDHVSLLVDYGGEFLKGKKKFRFEKWWLEREDFREVVTKAWVVSCLVASARDVWQFRIRTFKIMGRGWATNVTAELNKQKEEVAAEFNWLDFGILE
jgi:hypothetical protein